MTTYQDIYDTSKTTEDIHNTMAVTYEMATGEKNLDADDELTEEDRVAVANHLKEVIPELKNLLGMLEPGSPEEEVTVDDIAEARREEALDQMLKRTHDAVLEAVENQRDDCVRISLHIPASHLSEAQREKLEKDVVREAAIYSKMWMDALEFGGESLVMNDKLEPEDVELDEHEEEVSEAEEEVEMPPDDVIRDISNKYNETYQQMRADYDEDFTALEFAVIECLIEDGYIQPGSHYNVRTETVETMNGNKTSFVTGPKGSKTVKGKKS